MTLLELLSEQTHNFYRGTVRVTFDESLSTMDVAEMIRGIETVTIVTNAGTAEGRELAMYTVKVRTTMGPNDAFKFVRRQALAMNGIRKFEIGTKTIEKIAG